MSQPFDQSCILPAMGPVDSASGQFWVGNPWLFGKTNFNLSAYERNRVYWNRHDGGFVDISYLTGADSDGDSRGVVAADLDNDGRPDLLVRQSGGGPLRIYMNQFPKKNFLKVNLRGERSNRFGLGARLTAEIGPRRLVREMQAPNTFWGQSPAQVLFGLDEASCVDRLTIEWPSGAVQVLEGLAANQHIEVREQRSDYRVLTPAAPATAARR